MMLRVAMSCGVLALCGVAGAATWTVDDDLADNPDADFLTIQEAVDVASDGDEIVVEPGTYTSTGNFVINTLGKSITIRATGTPEETIIDGEGARTVVHLNGDTIIEGFTITGGSASYGGGIISGSGSPTLTDCVISGNTASQGGGINCRSNLTISGCTISDNTATDYGGGIWCRHDVDPPINPTLTDCTISNNTTGNQGGGIYCYRSNPTISGCTISNNIADFTGGGICFFAPINPTLTDTSVCCNAPNQIIAQSGDWIDDGSNHVADWCLDDCNCNQVSDPDDVADGTSYDCDEDLVPDECEIDCDGDGLIDDCDSEPDQDGNGVPDNCDPDCNENGIADGVEILNGWADDCDGNIVPDECQLDDGSATDCDEDGTLDHCQITADPDLDCDEDGAIDSCAIADGSVEDCNENGIPDSCDIANGGDADGDGYLDECECAADIAGPDGPGFPDGIVGTDDLLAVIGYWGQSQPNGDVNGDGIVGTDDLLAVIGAWGPCE